MTQGLTELRPEQLATALQEHLLPRLVQHLRARQPGHCMSIPDLDLDLSIRLCRRMRAEVPESEVVILTDGHQPIPSELAVTGTKLVELRNPLSDGSLRPPLLVFVPSLLRASAEDSFATSTFEEVPIGNLYGEIQAKLLSALPDELRFHTEAFVQKLQNGSDAWIYADHYAVVRFLLTAIHNQIDAETLGAALYELALVPDFSVFLHQDPLYRLNRNKEAVEKLTRSPKSERSRIADLGLADASFRRSLATFLMRAGLEDPRQWTRSIVRDRANWSLEFGKWSFEDGNEPPEAIYIGEVTANLPALQESSAPARLQNLVGQQILHLGRSGTRSFGVSFQVDPHPKRVTDLAKFQIQIVSLDGGPTGVVRTKSPWGGNRLSSSVNFSKANDLSLDEGWHFIRVNAVSSAGDLIPLIDEAGNRFPSSNETDGRHSPNESDLFYVIIDEEMDSPEGEQRAYQREVSLMHALVRQQFSALMDGRDPASVAVKQLTWREDARRSSDQPLALRVTFAHASSMDILVSERLAKLERQILAASGSLTTWRLEITPDHMDEPFPEIHEWPVAATIEPLVEARRSYFEALTQGQNDYISQAADFRLMRQPIVAYAEAYVQAVQEQLWLAQSSPSDLAHQALTNLRALLAIDAIYVSVTDYRGRRRQAALAAPTHPLRALWLGGWSQLAEQWLRAAQDISEFAAATRDALLRILSPIGFPPVMCAEQGRMLTLVENIHPFWSLYAPADEADPRGLTAEICTAFGLPEPSLAGSTIDGIYLGSRIERYLAQHPYISTLVINAFNPGHATVLADALLSLQRQPNLTDLRYDIRLFVPDPDAPGVGASLVDLIMPSSTTTASETDAFSLPTSNHLRPKLAVAIRSTDEFRATVESNAAHISILFDLFPGEEMGVSVPPKHEAGLPVFGLVQDYHVEYTENQEFVAWRRFPRHGRAAPLDDAEEFSDLLSSMPHILSQACAVAATGETGKDLRPVRLLALNASERALLHQVHEVSDWVFTIDRNLGIEFFDHGPSIKRPEYLIDHSPSLSGTSGSQMVVTSRSVSELKLLMRPALLDYGLPAESRHAHAFVEQLRSLSGRLAFKLISASSQRAEVIGLALARMVLTNQNVFDNQIVVPLDAHLDLYTGMQNNKAELGETIRFHRTDLALFDLDVATRTITCRLVEVKCYRQVGELGAYQALRQSIAEQIETSEKVLRYHFDPDHNSRKDRPDRALKSYELMQLLTFYLERALRYQIVDADVATEAHYFLQTLDLGYQLSFTRSAIIFDFERSGSDSPDSEYGIEYHRIGRDLILDLVNGVAEQMEVSATTTGLLLDSADEERPEVTQRSELSILPHLELAAFVSRRRRRSIDWEELQAVSVRDGQRTIEKQSETLNDRQGRQWEGSVPQLRPVDEPDSISTVEPLVEGHNEAINDPSNSVESYVTVDTDPSALGDGPEKAPLLDETLRTSATIDQPSFDAILGVTGPSPQYGILGEMSGRAVALDLNQTHTISLFGVQGGGKSYTLGTIVEMATMSIDRINRLPNPLATVIFHYSQTMDYKPEFTSMIEANRVSGELELLRTRYGASPQALSDVLLLVPTDKLAERHAEFPNVEVKALTFASAELSASHWRFLMGAVGNQATYMRQLNQIMRVRRNDLTLASLRAGIQESGLSEHLKSLANMRLDLAAAYIDDSTRLSTLIHPGRLIVVDLRDEFIEKDEALGLFVVVLQIFADATSNGKAFNKLVVFDEAHKYIENPDLVTGLVEVVREMRHKGTSILVASQDPPSVPPSIIELSSQIILHKFNSPAWLKHIQKVNAAFSDLSPERMSQLQSGEAYVWSSKASDNSFTHGAIKIRCRPRVTLHGGATRTAL